MSGNVVPVPMQALVAEVAAQMNGTVLGSVTLNAGLVTPHGTAGAVPGTLAAWRAETASVTAFGAQGDAIADANGVISAAGTDDTAAFALAFTWLAGAPGRCLLMPAGIYNLASLQAPLVMPTGATLRGAGMHRSRILWNDQTGQNLFVTAGTASVPAADIAFEDFTVTGSCSTHWQAASGAYPFLLQFSNGVAIRRVCSEWSCAMGMALRDCGDVVIDHPLVRYTVADGISVTSCNNVLITGAVVEWTGDDAVSWHSDTDEILAHGSFVLTGFRIRHAGGGVNALGAKLCVISGGVLELVRFQGISVGGSAGASEGYTSTYGVSISDVVIRDMLDAGLAGDGAEGCRALCINTAAAQPGALAAAPGLNSAAQSVVVGLAGHVDGNGSAASVPIAIGSGVTVSNVQVLVGRAPVAAYSAWGLGKMFTRHGWADPAVPATALQPVAVDLLSGILRDVRISSCSFEGAGGATAVALGSDVRLIACEFNACTFRDYAGCVFAGNGIAQDVVVSGGVVDLDPYLTSSGRASVAGRLDGSWQAGGASGAPMVVRGNGAGGLLLRNVALRNLYALSDGAPDLRYTACALHGAPAAVGINAGNKGIGLVPNGGEGFYLVLEESDPGSANFGQTLFVSPADAAGQPDSGSWIAGSFLRNAAPSVANGKILLGWSRLTTGSGNTAGVDWAPAYATIS